MEAIWTLIKTIVIGYCNFTITNWWIPVVVSLIWLIMILQDSEEVTLNEVLRLIVGMAIWPLMAFYLVLGAIFWFCWNGSNTVVLSLKGKGQKVKQFIIPFLIGVIGFLVFKFVYNLF